MKKPPKYIQLMMEAPKAKEKSLEPAHIPTKLARKNKPSTMSLKRHRKYSGHPVSGSHNPRIKEALRRESNATGRAKGIRNPKTSIKELFRE